MNTNEKEIRQLVEDWAVAVQNKDLDAALAKHTNDVIMFDVPLPLQSKGIEEYRKTWELFFESNRDGKDSFQILELHVRANEHIGFCYGLINVFDNTVLLTMGLQKIKSQWQICHEHHSYPAV